jgi:hypothetical protein
MRWILTAALLVVSFAALPTPAQTPEAGKNQIVTTGTGRVEVVPDQATVSLGVQAQRGTADEAMAEAGRVATRILARLQQLVIPRESIRTSAINLFPIYAREGTPPQVTGYRAAYTLTLTLADLGVVGRAIDGAVEAGATTVAGVSFGLRDPSKARSQALALAVREAREKAEAIAQAAGLRIRGIERIIEGGVEFRVPVADALPAPRAIGTPIEPGTVSVIGRVTIVFTY